MRLLVPNYCTLDQPDVVIRNVYAWIQDVYINMALNTYTAQVQVHRDRDPALLASAAMIDSFYLHPGDVLQPATPGELPVLAPNLDELIQLVEQELQQSGCGAREAIQTVVYRLLQQHHQLAQAMVV